MAPRVPASVEGGRGNRIRQTVADRRRYQHQSGGSRCNGEIHRYSVVSWQNHLAVSDFKKYAGGAKTGDTVIFLTDGQATSGVTIKDTILSNVKQALDRQRVTVHTIAFGAGADYGLLKSISIVANGLARKVSCCPGDIQYRQVAVCCQVYEDSDAALQMQGFYAQVGNPLLSDVKIKYVNASVEPGNAPFALCPQCM